MDIGGTIYVATHPTLAIRTKLRQIAVGAEWEGPPTNVSIEDFASMRLPEAMKKIAEAEISGTKPVDAVDHESLLGGVPKSAWSETDQVLMSKGEHPHGHPEHPYV